MLLLCVVVCTCSVQSVVCSAQSAECRVQWAVCSVQCAGCRVQCAVCSVQCAGRRVQGAGCSVKVAGAVPWSGMQYWARGMWIGASVESRAPLAATSEAVRPLQSFSPCVSSSREIAVGIAHLDMYAIVGAVHLSVTPASRTAGVNGSKRGSSAVAAAAAAAVVGQTSGRATGWRGGCFLSVYLFADLYVSDGACDYKEAATSRVPEGSWVAGVVEDCREGEEACAMIDLVASLTNLQRHLVALYHQAGVSRVWLR